VPFHFFKVNFVFRGSRNFKMTRIFDEKVSLSRAVPFVNPAQLFVIEQVIPLHFLPLLEVFLLVESERPLLRDYRVLRIKLA